MDKIEKYKNSIKSIIPEVINKISGPMAGYILTGKKEFNGMTILLLGEYHNINILCNPCLIEEKCIEIIELPQFISDKLNPNIVDLYIENEYETQKKSFTISKEAKGILSILGAKYFRKNKYIRTHISDVRERYLADILYEYNFNSIRNIIENTIYFFKNKNIGEILKYKKAIIDYLLVLKALNYLINSLVGDEFTFKKLTQKILDLFKINRQINKVIESHNNTKITNMMNYYKEYLLKNIKRDENTISENEINNLFKILKTLTINDDNNITDDQLLNNIEKIQNINLNILVQFKYFLQDFFNVCVDYYIFFRSLRKFDGKLQKNIIIYVGNAHATNIIQLYLKSKIFKLKNINKINYLKNESKGLINSCVTVI